MTINQVFSGKWFVAVLIVAAVAGGTAAGAAVALFRELPQIRKLESFTPSATTRIYSADRHLLAELFAEYRDPVQFDDIPPNLISALVATEDRQFYHHSGVDLKGIVRAVVKDVLAGEFVEGASTITQQLAKTLFLTPRKSLMRKLREAVLAIQIERRYTKKEILTLYLNQVYFGSGAYGIAAAADTFFGKPVGALSLAESALIAGMPKAPSVYSPLVNPERAVRRRGIVLQQMVNTGVISTDDYDRARDEPLELNTDRGTTPIAPFAVAYLRQGLESLVGAAQLYQSGLTVHTTLNAELQKTANGAVQDGLAALRQRMQSRKMPSPAPQAALVAMDVKTGGVLAMVGGADYRESSFNRAVSARRQPGSAFKPILYASAITRGYSQNARILDAPVAYPGGAPGHTWEPKNFSPSFSGEITFRKALAKSKNIPAVRLIDMLGPSSVAAFASQLGIRTVQRPHLSLALGTSEVTLLDLTAAYAVFANGGKRVPPFGITEVKDRNGRVLWQAQPHPRTIMDRKTAAVVTDMLRAVITEGTGRRARSLPRAVAGKTGTTNDYRDAWFVGFSPETAVGVWVGQDDNRSLGRLETGSRAALPIWTAFMSHMLRLEPVGYFDVPDGTVRIRIDPDSGERADDPKAGGVDALFRIDMLANAFPDPP